jgi:hypothetical protein
MIKALNGFADRKRRCLPLLPRVGEYGHSVNSFPSGSARTVQDSAPVCPMSTPARPEREKPRNLLVAVPSAAGEVEVHAVLDGLCVGDRHEAHADGRVLVGPNDDLAFTFGENLPAECLRPETGPAWAGRERQRRCDGVGQACRQYAQARRAGPTKRARFRRGPRSRRLLRGSAGEVEETAGRYGSRQLVVDLDCLAGLGHMQP